MHPHHSSSRTSDITLVTGGSGLIGGEIIVDLARRGHKVRSVTRAGSSLLARRRLIERLEKSPGYDGSLDPLIDVVAGDTGAPLFGLTREDLAGVTGIIHCAANTAFSDDKDEEIWRTNVGGAQRLVEVAGELPAGTRVVFVSTTSVVTAPEGLCLNETAPFAGYINGYTLSKREAEGIVLASGAGIVVARPSIVLSKGLRDRALARSILWAVPIMAEVGDIPVDQHARIDLVPVDHVATCLIGLRFASSLRERVYHISAGELAETFDQLRQAVIAKNPHLSNIRAIGRAGKLLRRKSLLKPLQGYLPFINAGVSYSFDRLLRELGEQAVPALATSYVPELVSCITLNEAIEEMSRP